ncbi:M57 family metalloprotease [Chitinophaga agri]|uniref:Dual-action HEIGH metallo-peptidase n=1 Tax=Chitinophaga agri TaxID=2703787 RepID=A0A6B9ZE33_9BACT|nr:M57 family metalloprotease [Chitinophaga agri]QHS58793.1 hypothetical protein GWR21_03990 [Chitinophaga agri]
MMKIPLRPYLMAGALSLFFYSCSKHAEKTTELSPSKDDAVIAYIKKLGFPASAIKDAGNEYIVEGDISFPKDMEVPSLTGPTTEQYYTGYLVSQANRTNIRVMVDASMQSMIAEVNSAIDQWNTVPNTDLHFTIVTSGSYDILVRDQNLGAGGCGQARFPINGLAGGLVMINKSYIAGNSFEQRQRTITHEFGHCIGFRHTNWAANGEPQNGTDDIGTPAGAIDVPGVGGTDAGSLMNGSQCGIGASRLSDKDKQAAASLYPKTFPNGSSGTLATMAGIDIGNDDAVYFWGLAGQVTRGNSTLIYGPTTGYTLPAGKTYADVIDMGIANTGYAYVWYKDGTVSAGSQYNLGSFFAPKPFQLPAGKTPADIVGIAIAKNTSYCYAWYSDGTVSAGYSDNLGAYIAPYPYTLAPGKTYTDIADIGIAASSGWCYAWYKDNTMSVGYSDDLDYYIPLKPMN